jgi:hypothetical protein
MAINEFVIKCGVEFGVDFDVGLVFCCEDYAKRDVFVLLLFSLLKEAFWC